MTSGAFAVTLPPLFVSFTGLYVGPSPTDTSNQLGGRGRHGSAAVTVDVPAAAAPPGRTFAVRYDKAIAYPLPDMVDGAPT